MTSTFLEIPASTRRFAESDTPFPHFLCRLSALPAEATEELSSAECARLLAALASTNEQIDAARDGVSALLFAAVNGQADREVRRRLINVRRKLFNGKLPSEDECVVLADPSLHPAQALVDLLHQRGQMQRELSLMFEREREDARARLRKTLQIEALRRGILASSESLFQALREYEDPDWRGTTAQRIRTERGLLRYVTRASMKATPYSTLCTVIAGEVVSPELVDGSDDSSHPLVIDGSAEGVSIVRLNKRLLGALIGRLVRRPSIRRGLPVETNPTLAIEGDEVVFLAVRQGREAFHRIDRNPLLDLIVRLVGPAKRAFGDLVRLLVESPDVECTPDEAEQLIHHLINSGFLRFHFGIPEQEAVWHVPLIALLERIGGSEADAVVSALETLGEIANRYGSAPAIERTRIAAEASNAATAALNAVGPNAPRWTGAILMEDESARAAARLPLSRDIGRCLADLRRLIEVTRRIGLPSLEQATMAAFFERTYPEQGTQVPLLQFYEDFHREFQKEHLDRIAKGAAGEARLNPLGLEMIARAIAARGRMSAVIRNAWLCDPEVEEVSIPLDDILACLDDVPDVADSHTSAGLFLEYAPPTAAQESPRLICGKGFYGEGFGKFFSRFLHLLPEELTTSIRERNAAFPDGVLAEIGGDGNFNANLHPPLLPVEIGYPTSETRDGAQINAADLFVSMDWPGKRSLTLRHKSSGERVVPIDLGFQNRDGRPALYQLLARFGPPSSFGFALPDIAAGGVRQAKDSAPVAPSIQRRPRLVLNDTLVICRQSWVIPSECIPIREVGESDVAWLLRLDAWRRRCRLPEEGYFRIYPRRVAGPPPKSAGNGDLAAVPDASAKPPAAKPTSRGTRNLSKPQYISFVSPLLLEVLEHALREVPTFSVVFEERYPRADQLPTWQGKRHTAELMLEVDL